MLALWDIDGTLVRVDHGIGREMFVRTFQALFSMDVDHIVEGMSFAGRTDRGLVYDIVDAAGISRASLDEIWTDFTREMTQHAQELITPQTAHALSGAVETLQSLADDGVVCGLITGNIDGIAQHKLAMAGVPNTFVAGAFGDHHADRRHLPPVALKAVSHATGAVYTHSTAVIIGDALGDVACAVAHHIPCVAVSTGVHSTDELRQAGATHVLASLNPGRSTATLLRQVLGYL